MVHKRSVYGLHPAGSSGLKFETAGREGVKRSPDEAVNRNDHHGHHQGGGQEQAIIAAVGRLADDRTQPDRRDGLAAEMEVFSHDAGIPRPARGGNETRDQVRKYGRQEQSSPALGPCSAGRCCRLPSNPPVLRSHQQSR